MVTRSPPTTTTTAHNVSAGRAEGAGPAGVQVGVIQLQQNLDVVVAISLQGMERRLGSVRFGSARPSPSRSFFPSCLPLPQDCAHAQLPTAGHCRSCALAGTDCPPCNPRDKTMPLAQDGQQHSHLPQSGTHLVILALEDTLLLLLLLGTPRQLKGSKIILSEG